VIPIFSKILIYFLTFDDRKEKFTTNKVPLSDNIFTLKVNKFLGCQS